MTRKTKINFFMCLLFFCTVCFININNVMAAERMNTQRGKAWSVHDTINAALSYNPSMKEQQEARNIASSRVEQAKSGYYPRLDFNASTGWRTISVPK